MNHQVVSENGVMMKELQPQNSQQNQQQNQQNGQQQPQNPDNASSLLRTASDNFRLNQFFASSNANMFHCLQQNPLLYSALVAGIPGLAGQVPGGGGQGVDLNLLNALMGRSQNAGANPLLFQQAFANAPGNSFTGQNAASAGAAGATPMPLPASSLLSLNQSITSVLHGQQRAGPTSQKVQSGFATMGAAGVTVPPAKSNATPTDGGHPAIIVYMECDEDSLSDYQCLLRKQVELFEANADDVQWNAQGRNKPIVLGQVGIRCRYCARLPTWSRARGAVYYSATLDGLYQAAQNMAKNHLCKHCRLIPENSKQKLNLLRDCKRRAAGGKKYWAEGARVLGVSEYKDGLRFKDSVTGKKQQEQKK